MADDTNYLVPQLLGAQYTFITQIQNSLHSPYAGPLSLNPRGDHARSHTFGAYFGMPLTSRLSAYVDVEMFRGEAAAALFSAGICRRRRDMLSVRRGKMSAKQLWRASPR